MTYVIMFYLVLVKNSTSLQHFILLLYTIFGQSYQHLYLT